MLRLLLDYAALHLENDPFGFEFYDLVHTVTAFHQDFIRMLAKGRRRASFEGDPDGMGMSPNSMCLFSPWLYKPSRHPPSNRDHT